MSLGLSPVQSMSILVTGAGEDWSSSVGITGVSEDGGGDDWPHGKVVDEGGGGGDDAGGAGQDSGVSPSRPLAVVASKVRRSLGSIASRASIASMPSIASIAYKASRAYIAMGSIRISLRNSVSRQTKVGRVTI